MRDSQTRLFRISEQAAGTRKENILANRLVEAVLRAERRCFVFLRRRECREGVRCRLPPRVQSARQRTHFRRQEARVRIAATRPHAEELHLRHGIRDGQETVARSARILDRSMDKDWLTKADLPHEEAKKSKQRRSFEMSFASFCFRFLTNIVENHKFIDHRRLYHLDRRSQIHRVDRVANTLQIRDSSGIMMKDFIIDLLSNIV